MYDPDNIPGGYGGIDTEALWMLLFFIVVIIAIFMGIYIAYLKLKLDKYENQEKPQKVEDKQE